MIDIRRSSRGHKVGHSQPIVCSGAVASALSPEGMFPQYPPLGPPPLGFLLPVVLPPGSCRLRAAGVWDVGLRVAGLRAAGVQDAILGVAGLEVCWCIWLSAKGETG